MALFANDAPPDLAAVLGNQANQNIAGINDQYGQAKKRLISQQSTGGRLRSKVSNYQFGDLAKAQAGDVSGVYSGLADALGGVPAEDYLNQNDYQRNIQLAKLIGDLNKPSALQEALGGLQAAGSAAMLFAAL